MGLRVSRAILESHGGRWWAADNSPRGATFQFTLPTAVSAGIKGQLVEAKAIQRDTPV
jgi:signal transduction histidine kinase